MHIQWLTSANDVPMSWAVCPKEEHRTSSHCDFAQPCLNASANHLSELLQYECSFSMSPFVSCISSILPCCRLCMCVLSLRLPYSFLFLFCLLPLFAYILNAIYVLYPNCYCSLIFTFKFATVSFNHHCISNGMCFSCETFLSAVSIMSAVKHWVTRKTHVVAVNGQ